MNGFFIKAYRWGRNAGLLLVLVLLTCIEGYGQYSNEWINFGQSYFKIPVAADGIYRLTYGDLQAAGAPVGSIDPRRINLFHRGVEQAILVTGQNDAVFDPGDVIEFYGTRNDGSLDADLYVPASAQPHAYYNLYNDTTAYFLTWNPLPVLGKRINTFSEINSLGLPVDAAHVHEHREIFTTEFSHVGDVQPTSFGTGEGWTGNLICTVSSGCTGQQDFLLESLTGGVPSAGTPSLEILLAGRGGMSHQVEVYAGANGGSTRLLGTTNFLNYETSLLSFPLAWTDVGGDGKMTVRVKITPTGARDQVSVSYINLILPQNYDVQLSAEKIIHVAPNPGNKSYIEIQNPAPASRVWDITASADVSLIGTTPITGGLSAIIPNTLAGRTLYVSNATRSGVLQKVTFRAISPSLHNFIILSHRSLMKPALGYGDAVQAYAAYRASAAGGGYDTLTMAMDQLYNQFNYGETSPRAIFQFMKFLDAGGDPKFLFLLGKGMEASYGYYRKTSHLPTDFHDLVPSAGIPASDIAFTAGLGGTTNEPGVPTGRLTASTPSQVAAYLNKVKEAEALPFNEMWRKDLLHLSGGINPGEPAVFRSIVDGFKAIAEDFYLGGKAETISKQTLNVELINVKDQVNKGLNLITFFGHSGPGTIDIDIGYVSDPTLGYQNAGKYPGFLINGCNAGRFFDNRVTFGEDWMLTPSKGAKAFIAHSSFGFVNALREYSNLFYSVAYGDSTYIHKGIGEVQKETARRYLTAFGNGTLAVTQVQQMVLLGDPAVQLFGANKPDYEVSSGAVSIVSLDGTAVTAQTDSFAVEIRVRNFGRAHPEPLHIRVERRLSDNSTITYDSVYAPVMYTETLRLIIRKENSGNEFGNNVFTVTLDPDLDQAELKEDNNVSAVNYFIPVNGSKNLFPPPFAIVPTTNINLVFQHTDLTSETRSFKVEVDTAATFDSPYLNRKTVSGKGLAKLPLTLLPNDSLVYYWRTQLENPLPGESTEWTASSFAFINNSSEGWAQLEFPQFLDNDTTGVKWNRVVRRLEFIGTVSTVDIETFGSANPNSPSGVSLKINQEEFNVASQGQPCRNNTLNFLAFDKNSTAPYVGIPFSFFDPRTCGRAPEMINSFTVAEMELATNGLAQWIANISPSDSVLIFSIGDAGYASWSSGLKLQLEQVGVSTFQLDVLEAGEPFVLFGKKGTVGGSAKLYRPSGSPGNAQGLTVNATVTGRYSSGLVSSDPIGPAQQWGVLTTQVHGGAAADVVKIDIIGIDLSGQETLVRQVSPGGQSVSDIDASVYPYLLLVLHVKDSIDLTPAQLRKWMVTFTPTAEGVLVYDGSTETELLEEGDNWQSPFGFTNISTRQFPDSLAVRVDVFSRTGRILDRHTFNINAPLPGDTTHFDVEVFTKGKGGLNDVTVYVNPRVLPELYYDNNILPLYARLDVLADETGPVLDVTIDGRHAINGDVVSASPVIRASVIDRNPFLLKTDTTGFNLFLRGPCLQDVVCSFQRIDFTNPDLSWTPASPTEEFEVLYRPKALEVGEYVLKVEATDANGNSSGDLPYELLFNVSDDVAFALQAVYPNPSPDVFFFKLVIGGVIPDDFRLELFSSMGSAVRTFGNEVLPVLHVGTNEIQVGAQDASGNLLPVGIYLFRFTVTSNGKQFVESGRLVVMR